MKRRLLILTTAAVTAIGFAGCGSSGSDTGAATGASTGTDTTTSATIDGKDLFVNGKPSSGAVACGGCHALKAAGTTGTAGPDLDKIAPEDKAPQLAEMITDPNGEIVAGYTKDVMPQDYAKTLTADEVTAIATYIDDNSAHAE